MNSSTAKNWGTQKERVKTNTEFWQKKIERNIQRDIEVNEYLTQNGWIFLRFWSQEIQNELDKCVALIQAAITSKSAQI